MRYYYKSSYSNYKIAVSAYIKSRLSRRLVFHICMWGLFASGVLIALALHFFTEKRSLMSLIGAPLAAGLIAGGIMTPLLRPFQLKRVYKAWNGELLKDKDIYIEVDGPALLSGVEGEREAKFQRASICNIVENDAIILLFLNKKKFLYFSKNSLPSAFFDDLHTWLALPGAPPPC